MNSTLDTFAIVTTLGICGWAAGRWALDRFYQWADDRADRRTCTNRAARLHQVADRANAVMALPEDQLIEQLEAKYDAPDHAPKEG